MPFNEVIVRSVILRFKNIFTNQRHISNYPETQLFTYPSLTAFYLKKLLLFSKND